MVNKDVYKVYFILAYVVDISKIMRYT